jgi:flagellar protein FliS
MQVVADKSVRPDVQGKSPEQVILEMYDIGLAACARQDKYKTRKVLTELVNALNFEYSEIAASFYNVYQFALHQAELENYDEVIEILYGLRTAWEKIVPSS